jgi:Fic family protein
MNYRAGTIGGRVSRDGYGNPTGRLVEIKGTHPRTGRAYRAHAFVPEPLPGDISLTSRTHKLVSEAERAVGRLDAAAGKLPNPGILVRPALMREAVSTSALEGTHAELFQILEADYIDPTQYSQEVREVRNYVSAASKGHELITTEPIRLNLIRRLQAMLVEGTRGDSYDAGQLRTGQVYIGEQRGGIEEARFVPVPAGADLAKGMDDWEKWVNAQDDLPLLVRIALAHYQFETLHPFSDGNGRIGRLIISLQLVDRGAMSYPILNLSSFLEPRKEEYKDLMLAVSQRGEYDAWIQFFAEGVRMAAEEACQRIDRLVAFRDEMLESLRKVKARGVVLEIVDDLLAYPVITVTMAASLHHVTFPPANAAIQRLVDLGFLVEVTGKNYGRVFLCRRVMEIVDDPVAA